SNLLAHTVLGAIDGQVTDLFLLSYFRYRHNHARVPIAAPREASATIDNELPPGEHRQRAKDCFPYIDKLKYKLGALTGIWATPPYLHNGSVPTLYDLLLPSSLRPIFKAGEPAPRAAVVRPENFYVGNREFDPVRVGFDTQPSPGAFLFRVRD